MSHLIDQIRGVIDAGRATVAPTSDGVRLAAEIDALASRLEQPLRVAIAGKVKAGKSTLLNALVSERLAPTDAGECTTIVTWYRDGSTYRVTMHPKAAEAAQVPFRRTDGSLEIDLRGTPGDQIDRLEVEWPSAALSDLTLMDTPGIDSISTHLSDRTHDFLSADSGSAVTDAVLYLMRHLHASDVRFLESFHDQEASRPSAINSIGVLSRADEIGVGRLDAFTSAKRIAARYSEEPKIRRLCQVVTPVAGLLAETATTLRQDEFASLQAIAAADRAEIDALMLTVDRFANAEASIAVTPHERQELLDRFGIFGIRLGCALIRQQRATTSAELSDLLVDKSGLGALRSILSTHLSARADVLRARSALLALDRIVDRSGATDTARFDAELERIRSTVHEFSEVELLSNLRAGRVRLADADAARAERLLGADGGLAHQRLGADASTTPDELMKLAIDQHGHWQRVGESPLTSRPSADAARVLVRTCEGLLVAGRAADG